MSDLFRELRCDHRSIVRLLSELRGDPATTGPSAEQRAGLARELVKVVSTHEVLEERFMWPAVHEMVDDDQLRTLGLTQETRGKKLLNELEKTDPGNDDFRTLLLQVTSDLRQHVTFEEGQVWPRLQLLLSPDRAEDLGHQVASARHGAPIRPHPLVPAEPHVLELLAPLTGRLDRFREAVRSRV